MGQCDPPDTSILAPTPAPSLQDTVDPGALHHPQLKYWIKERVLPRDQLLACCSLWPSLEYCQLCHFLKGAQHCLQSTPYHAEPHRRIRGFTINETLGRSPLLTVFRFPNSTTLSCDYTDAAGAVLLSSHCLRGTVASQHPASPPSWTQKFILSDPECPVLARIWNAGKGWTTHAFLLSQ